MEQASSSWWVGHAWEKRMFPMLYYLLGLRTAGQLQSAAYIFAACAVKFTASVFADS